MREGRLKKGDTVKVITGHEKGKTGKIIKLISNKDRVFVEKLNFIKRHQKPTAKGKGGIVEKEGPINISNVMLICNKCDNAVRMGYRILDDGSKVRFCKKCHEILDV